MFSLRLNLISPLVEMLGVDLYHIGIPFLSIRLVGHESLRWHRGVRTDEYGRERALSFHQRKAVTHV